MVGFARTRIWHPAKLGTGPRIHSETEDRAPFRIAYQQGRNQKVAAETLKTHKKAQPIFEFAMDHLSTSEENSRQHGAIDSCQIYSWNITRMEIQLEAYQHNKQHSCAMDARVTHSTPRDREHTWQPTRKKHAMVWAQKKASSLDVTDNHRELYRMPL